jgi:hypothetical protein
MLLSNRHVVSVWMGRKARLGLADTLTATPGRVPAARGVSQRAGLEGSCRDGHIRLGMCRACQWWPIDLEAHMADTTMGVGIEAAFQPFRLRVSGHSGCNGYTGGEPTHAAGSSASPPTVEPQRCTRRRRWSERAGRLSRSPGARHITETQP